MCQYCDRTYRFDEKYGDFTTMSNELADCEGIEYSGAFRTGQGREIDDHFAMMLGLTERATTGSIVKCVISTPSPGLFIR
ncbi:MAG: hypothetical protein ACLR6J_07730 [Parabacteroides merdae]